MQRLIMPDFTPEQLRRYLPAASADEATTGVWWIGLSGGLDSTVLLYALTQLKLPVTLQALHINHQISPHADTWQQQCEAVCRAWGIAFHAEKVQVKNTGKGIEDAAREARYRVFEHYVGQGDYLLTAHHANDQAETLLLRLMRGTGPRGLAAMASERMLANGGKLIRPLLSFARAELEAYAHAQQLTWVEDESNQDDHYDRNYLRNQIIPLLQTRWPAFMRKWQQAAELCAQQEELLSEFAQHDLEKASPRSERVGQSINLVWLKTLSPARRQNLLRVWLRNLGCELPESAHWQQLENQLFHARIDASVKVAWGKYALQPYQDRLYLLPTELPLLKLQFIETSSDDTVRLRSDLPDIHLRTREGGERCKPAGRAHSQTLKKLLQEYQLEPWLRDQLPLVYSGNELVAVGDLWVCDGYPANSGEPGFKLVWQ